MFNYCLLYWTQSHVCHALGVIKFCSLELTMTIMTFSNWTPVQAARTCALSLKSARSRVRGPPNVEKYNTALCPAQQSEFLEPGLLGLITKLIVIIVLNTSIYYV